MKRIIQIAAVAVFGAMFAMQPLTAQVKTKQIKICKSVCYEGEALKKTPAGKGTLYINQGYTSEIRIKGDFDGNNVSNAEVTFDSNGLSFKGEVSYEKDIDRALLIFTDKAFQLTLKEGKFYKSDRALAKIVSPATISFDCNYAPATYDPTIVLVEELRQEARPLLKWAKYFAGSDDFEIRNPDKVKCVLMDKGLYFKELTSEEKYLAEKESRAEAVFKNGQVCKLYGSEIEWKRPNGDFVVFMSNRLGQLECYEITGKNNKIRYQRSGDEEGIVSYTFPNGNTIEGKSQNIPNSFNDVMSPSFELDWKWETDDIFKYLLKLDYERYKLTFSDGTYYDGTFYCSKVEGDKLAEQSYNDGTLYDSTGQVIERYMRGVSDTKRAAIEKAEQQKAEAEKRAKEKADQQKKQQLYNKYGKKYVDTILNSAGKKVLTGTPIALLKEFNGTRIAGVLLELTLDVDWGDSQCYKLWTARPDTQWYGTTVGYIWVQGGKVTSVSYNQ